MALDPWEHDCLEPRVAELLDARLKRRREFDYAVLRNDIVEARVQNWLRAQGHPNALLSGFQRMPGGASKEQFCFILHELGKPDRRLVLRIDPRESIVETCRFREAEALEAVKNVLPVAPIVLIDGVGKFLGQPGLLMEFMSGVTKPPTDAKARPSGVGTTFAPEWRERLAPQFVDTLATVHNFDWRNAHLPHFSAPTQDPLEAALWQVNWWSRVAREDAVASYPLLALAEEWMRAHLPRCEDPVLLHGDLRTGNFMFDPKGGEITAIFDWELAHIGDFHEDLGWSMQRLFAAGAEDGQVLVCNLLTRNALIAAYERRTGRVVNRRTLAFYEILSAFKCAAMNLGTGAGIAMRGNSHQDVLLSWLSSVGHIFSSDIARLLQEELVHDA